MGQYVISYQEAEYAARLQRSARNNLIGVIVMVALFGGIGGVFIPLSTKDISYLFMNLGTASAGSATPLLVKVLGGFVVGAAVAAVFGWLLSRNSTARYAGLVLYNLANNNLLEEALSEGVYQRYPWFGLRQRSLLRTRFSLDYVVRHGIRDLQADSARRRLRHLYRSYDYLCQQCGLRAFPSGFTYMSAYTGVGLSTSAALILGMLAAIPGGIGNLVSSFADNPATSALLAVVFIGPAIYFAVELGRQQLGTADGIAGAVRQRLQAQHEARVAAETALRGNTEM